MIPNSNSKSNYSRDFDRFAKNSLSWESHMYIFQLSIKCVTFHAFNSKLTSNLQVQYNKMRTAIKNRLEIHACSNPSPVFSKH
jgi:hypothetical protein